ncbi:MAG: beta-lactamase family protein [Clostridia bacterium]|nr:beta-lactamase family protein [Clostridia bacterium]
MKNATPEELRALSKRASAIADRLPPLHTGSGGTFAPEDRGALSRCAESILRKNRAVGASLILLHPSGRAESLHFGHARLNPRIPVTKRTCMRVASVSKLVMTFGALSLLEDGLLNLDRDVSQYLGYCVRSPHAPDVPITMRMLLTHTAGISDSGPYGTRGMEPGCTLRELLSDPASWHNAPPGSAFRYSNLGAGAAGVIMELAAGMPFDDVLRQRVFDPLQIRASYDPRRIAPAEDLADGYGVRGVFPPRLKYDAARLAARPPEPFCPEQDYLIAAGRLITDSGGMEALLRLLASKDGMGVLSPASLVMMRSPQDGMPDISACGRGLNTAFLPGVFRGFSPVGHQGVAYGMCAELFADPETGAGVGVMTSGVRLVRRPPLMRAGFDLLALGFAALRAD